MYKYSFVELMLRVIMTFKFKEKTINKNSLTIRILFSHGKGDDTSSRKTNIAIPVDKKDLVDKIMVATFSFIKDIEKKVRSGVDIDDMEINVDTDECNRYVAFFNVEDVEIVVGLDTDEDASDLRYAIPYHALFEYFDENGKCFTVKL